LGRGEFCKVVGEGLFFPGFLFPVEDIIPGDSHNNTFFFRFFFLCYNLGKRSNGGNGFLRVIAGLSKGKRLKVPKGPDIRPITDTIKEALFNTIGPYLEGQTFLDLFAGSGAVGIEALSRLAEEVVFVERNPQAVTVIRENLQSCQLDSKARIIRGDVFRVVNRLAKERANFDIIYVDPPFRQVVYFEKIMSYLGVLLSPQGTCIVRSPKSLDMPGEAPGLTRARTSVYGDSVLNYYHNTVDSPAEPVN
jgi:16S rRNA (guanine966-N2)-methyltransferase